MSTFCIVAPLNILTHLNADGLMGYAHLLLAHDVAKPENHAGYKKLFVEPSHPYRITILDNSAIELGQAVDLDMVREAANHCAPTVIALPDILLDGPATVRAVDQAITPWYNAFAAEIDRGRLTFMAIPQGKTLEEFVRCAEGLSHYPERLIGWWGVPRNIVKNHADHSRWVPTQILHTLNPKRKIHLLGFSDNMVDDVLCAHTSDVTSIDSAVPLRHHSAELSLMDVLPPRGSWWEEAPYTEYVKTNLIRARQWFDLHPLL